MSPGLRLTMPALLWEVMSWVVVLLPPPAARSVLRAANGGPHKEPKIRLPPGPRADALAMYWTRRYPIGADDGWGACMWYAASPSQSCGAGA